MGSYGVLRYEYFGVKNTEPLKFWVPARVLTQGNTNMALRKKNDIHKIRLVTKLVLGTKPTRWCLIVLVVFVMLKT